MIQNLSSVALRALVRKHVFACVCTHIRVLVRTCACCCQYVSFSTTVGHESIESMLTRILSNTDPDTDLIL